MSPSQSVASKVISGLRGKFDSRGAQDNIVTLTPEVKSFTPDNSIIRAGTVQVNRISPYLADLPDAATATLLVTPQDLANINAGYLATWDRSIESIRDIKDYHGLDGMQIYDRPKAARDVTYEKQATQQLRTLWHLAQAKGEVLASGLFMPTMPLVNGRGIGSGDEILETNLYSLREEIGEQGDEFITEAGYGDPDDDWVSHHHCMWTATEDPDSSYKAYYALFTSGAGYTASKCNDRLSARAVALEFQPL